MPNAGRALRVGRETDDARPAAAASTGVQSVARAFDILEALADLGGVAGISELTAHSGLALPTIHRLVRTLVELGYVRQEPSRKYALGARLTRLGDGAGQLFGTWAEPHLRRVVDEIGESANLALLDGDEIVYIAQAPGRHAMRMFTEVGRRAPAHCTAVGKAMLAWLDPDVVRALLTRAGMPARTSHTIIDPAKFMRELKTVKRRGYALDDGEQELGVRCVAVALPGDPARAAVSISGPLTRMTDEVIRAAVPLLSSIAEPIAEELAYIPARPS